MKFLVDTDYVVDYLKRREVATKLLTTLAVDGLGISLITYGEIYEGILFGENRARHEAAFRGFLRIADVVALNRTTMRRFAQIRGDLRRTGEIIGDADILIAATAAHYDLTIVTRNRTHFERIPDLKLYQTSSTGV